MTQYEELPSVLTVEEVSDFLKLSRNTVYEMIARKELPSVRLGRSIRITKKALIAQMEGE